MTVQPALVEAVFVEAAFVEACRQEVYALKPGNVHVHADGHGMTVADFVRSAEAAAAPLCRSGSPLGRRILDAVTATRAAVGQNTNLGILLLCGPLAMAAERGGGLQAATQAVVREADLDDAKALFDAIALARPGGLGQMAEHDVRRPATVTPLVAMQAAAGRDRIAGAWSDGFIEIFGGGLGEYRTAVARWRDPGWATTAAYLHFMSGGPDSHIARKHGDRVAADVQLEAAGFRCRLARSGDPAFMQAVLLDWDADLKARGINPGTSADLTVATLFAFYLANGL